jgi:CRISPR-associated endonuclease Cas1
MIERTLLINQPFALRQNGGIPVFTTIETIESQYNESEIDDIIYNLNRQKKTMGLTTTQFFDVKYKEMLKEAPKKSRKKTDYPINFSVLKRILITPNGKGYISTYFLEFCKVHQIAIYFVDGKGKIEASFIPFHYLKPSLALKQYEAKLNGKDLEIAKYLITLKLESIKMVKFIPNVRKAKDIHAVVSVEAIATTKYHSNWLFPDEWNWEGRRNMNVRTRTNRNASDPINSMLNLGHGILAQQMSEILLGKGFELSVGFIHDSEGHNKYWNQLSYDFVEPWRKWIDNCVKEMITNKEIKPIDFTFSDDKSYMVFKDKALGIALNRFMDILDPLEHKSLPIIRAVEKMLLGSHHDE